MVGIHIFTAPLMLNFIDPNKIVVTQMQRNHLFHAHALDVLEGRRDLGQPSSSRGESRMISDEFDDEDENARAVEGVDDGHEPIEVLEPGMIIIYQKMIIIFLLLSSISKRSHNEMQYSSGPVFLILVIGKFDDSSIVLSCTCPCGSHIQTRKNRIHLYGAY